MTTIRFTPEQEEAIRRATAAFSESLRAVGERIIQGMRPVIAGLVEFGRRWGKVLAHLLKKHKAKQRNLRRMNRKTRAVILRSK